VPITVSEPYGATARELDVIARAILNMPNEKVSHSILSRVFSRMLGVNRGVAGV